MTGTDVAIIGLFAAAGLLIVFGIMIAMPAWGERKEIKAARRRAAVEDWCQCGRPINGVREGRRGR